MKPLPDDLYQKIEILNQTVVSKLRQQGIILPVKTNSSRIRIGKYFIEKNKNGFFEILSHRGESMVSNINLPQTAALVANNLALGKWLDRDLIAVDQKYGHASFDELVHQKSAERNIKLQNYDKAEIMMIKSSIARHKKENYKRSISASFEKLLAFR
jgi:hypothetical protein